MKQKTIGQLKKKLDKAFSLYIRQKYADEFGMVKCYTCPSKKHWKEMQCGHFVSRRYHSLRFDERNCRPQCPGCNLFNQGAADEFALALTREYGPQILEELNREKRAIKKWTRLELENLIQTFSQTD